MRPCHQSCPPLSPSCCLSLSLAPIVTSHVAHLNSPTPFNALTSNNLQPRLIFHNICPFVCVLIHTMFWYFRCLCLTVSQFQCVRTMYIQCLRKTLSYISVCQYSIQCFRNLCLCVFKLVVLNFRNFSVLVFLMS